MQDLVDLVASEGPKKGEIKLDVLRRGKHETMTLTPEDRPANAAACRGPNMLRWRFRRQRSSAIRTTCCNSSATSVRA